MSELSDLALRKKGGATRYCGGLFRSKSADFVPDGGIWKNAIFVRFPKVI